MSGRPRGFGFVTFEDARDAADAVKDMDGYVVRYLLCGDTSDAKLRTMRALAHFRMLCFVFVLQPGGRWQEADCEHR